MVAFVLPIKQDRSCGDPVKTEYDEDQGVALVEPDEEAVELRYTALLRMAAKHSAAIFIDVVTSKLTAYGCVDRVSRRARQS